MAIFGRLKGPKKSTIEEKKRDALLPVAKPEQPKYVHVPVHAAADSLNVIALPVKSNMRQQVREQKIGSNKFIAPRLKSSQTWSPGDLSITSVLEQPLEIGQVRKSTRHSSFNSSNRRPPFKSSTSLARSRSLLANTIVEEELLETADELPIESSSSSDSEGLEIKQDYRKLDSRPNNAQFAQSLPELASDPLIEISESLQANHPIKGWHLDKIDSILTMPITRSPSPLMSQSQRAYAERSSPNLKTLPSIFQTNPPALDLAVKSSEDDWVLETSRVSRASTKSLSEEIKSRAQQWQAKDIDHAASPEGHINLPKDQSSLSDSRTSSIELPLRSRRRSRICESFDSTSSADRSEYEYIARQAEAYNTVLGHLYPEGKSVASLPDSTRHLHQSQRLFQFQSYGSRRSSSVSPERNHPQWNYPVHRADVSSARNDISHYQPRGGQMPNMQAHPEKDQFQDFDRGSQTPQRGVSASPYRSTPDRTIHVSRYPSRKRASSDGKNPTYNDWESQYEQDYFSPQQDARPLSPEPPLIPLESRRKSMPIYVQEHPSRRVSIQRYHTMDGYVQPNQVSEQTSSIYTSNRISFTTHESYDSYTRASYIHDNRRSTAIDERIAIAHIDSSYRQSKINLTLDYAESQEVQEPSQDDQRHSHLGTSRFPQPPSNDSSRKLRQLLGSEYREGGPRSPPAPFSECLMLQMQSQSPIVTKLDQSPSPAALSRASSVASSGKKVLDMPRSSDRKKKSFLGLLRKKKSSGTLLAVN